MAGDSAARAELAALGAPGVPVVARGTHFVSAQDLVQVAAFLGIAPPQRSPLPPEVLIRRFAALLELAAGYVRQIPAAHLDDQLPGRPRSLESLGNHVLAIAEAWLEVAGGAALDSVRAAPEPSVVLDPDTLTVRAHQVAAEIRAVTWLPWTDSVETFYGPQDHHQVLERCTWHLAQHTRQIAFALTNLGIEPAPALEVEWLAGLPLPEGIWDG